MSVNQANDAVKAQRLFCYICSMIVKKKNRFEVKSKEGKPMGSYSSREEAVKRLRQIEFFKRKKR